MNHPAVDRNTASLLKTLKATLAPLADPERAQQMSSYMRGKFEYLGIATPVRRAAAVPIIRAFKPADALSLLDASRSLWSMPEREYQYAGLDLLDCHEKLLTTKELPALLKLVEEKSWWDTVDSLAGVIGRIVRQEKQAGQLLMDRCVEAKNLWVRRVAMLHQLGWRGETDTARLFGYAERLAPETDFFIRKAIGWALRDYAKHDRTAVEEFVRQRQDQLSPLTCREALLLRTKPK
jgi:3-methyladenine DNA glycosylase AlkD